MSTCHFSGLPIQVDEEVLVIPVAMKKSTTATFIYPTDPAIPITLPIIARYDGEGSIKDADKLTPGEGRMQKMELLLGHKKQGSGNVGFQSVIFNKSTEYSNDQQLREKIKEDKISDSDSLKKGEETLSQFISNVVERSRMVVDMDLKRVGLIYIKKSVYDALLPSYQNDKLKLALQLNFRMHITEDRNFRDLEIESIEEIEHKTGLKLHSGNVEEVIREQRMANLPDWLQAIRNKHCKVFTAMHRNNQIKIDYNDEDFLKIHEPLEELAVTGFIVDQMMQDLCKTYMPTSGHGRSRASTSIIEKMAQITVKEIRAEQKRRHDEAYSYD